jgi:hypothetical protein
VVQLDLGQPAGQQLGGGERRRVQDLDLDVPGLVRQLPGDCPQCHRRVGQVGHEVTRPHGGALPDAGVPGLRAGVRGAGLPRPGADQQVPHGVGVAGHVRENVRPGPPRQQRRGPQVGFGKGAGIVEQSLRGHVDLAAQLPLCLVHQPTLSAQDPRATYA